MSTLHIRLPCRVVADSAPNWLDLACQFALVSHDSSIERQGTAPLSALSDVVAKSQHVVLLLAASDVTLLRVKVPPLSSAKLKAALPNLVEDKMINDPAECVVVAGGLSEGLRTIAVVQRAWLELLTKTLISFGARHIAALPAQLCLPYQPELPGSVTAAISVRNDADQQADINLTLRLSEQDGIGLAIAPELNESAASVAIETLCTMVPEAPIALYVPQSLVREYQEVINQHVAHKNVALSKRINVYAENWSRWIAGANSMALDLMKGLGAGNGPKLDWQPWRWPLALAAALLAINSAALNIDWWRMKNETNSLRATMIQIYRSAYPKESVIIDPIAQIQQKIAIAKHDSGQAAPDDFTAITAALGEAWASVVNTAAGKTTPAIAALDYHEHSLLVRLKPGGEAPTQQVKTTLAKHGLSLSLASSDPATQQSGAVVWKIGSAK